MQTIEDGVITAFSGAFTLYDPVMKESLQSGSPAPDLSGVAVGGEFGEGRPVTLATFAGRPLVLYFYPKDDTPGCTTQACSLRDNWARVSPHAQVLGVSIDSPASHRKFLDKFELPFPLLSDEGKTTVEAYGVWAEKSMYGKKYMGTERSTFVIDAEGNIMSVLDKVKPGEHVDQVLDALGVKS